MAKHREKLVMNRTWRRDVLAASLIGLTVAACGPRPSLGQAAPASRAWLDLETALRATSLGGRPTLIVATTPSDASTRQLRAVLPAALGDAYQLAELDAQAHAEWVKRLGITRVPGVALYVRGPGGLKLLGSRSGVAEPRAILAWLGNPGRTDTTAPLTDPALERTQYTSPQGPAPQAPPPIYAPAPPPSASTPAPVPVYQAAAPIYQIQAPLSQAPAPAPLVVSPAPSPPILVNPPQQTIVMAPQPPPNIVVAAPCSAPTVAMVPGVSNPPIQLFMSVPNQATTTPTFVAAPVTATPTNFVAAPVAAAPTNFVAAPVAAAPTNLIAAPVASVPVVAASLTAAPMAIAPAPVAAAPATAILISPGLFARIIGTIGEHLAIWKNPRIQMTSAVTPLVAAPTFATATQPVAPVVYAASQPAAVPALTARHPYAEEPSYEGPMPSPQGGCRICGSHGKCRHLRWR